MDTIQQSVGVRNGVTMLPNTAADLRTITGLLDRIPLANGGTAATPGLWISDRTTLIAQVTAAIVSFQTANQMRVIDGAVDPGGSTLRRMNSLAGPWPVTATVESGDVNSALWIVAEPTSLDGAAPLVTRGISPPLTRKLVRVTGTSIKWFGVVTPLNATGGVAGGEPLIFFTPSPWQGGYQDPGYDTFTSWNGLWDKYTSVIGSQLVASGARQILVIPFYKNSQASNLGAFLTNWRQVISAAVGAAINSIDPLFLRDQFEFSSICSASFSNGIVTQQNFNTRGDGAASMTRVVFDLDGQAAGSSWRPGKGVIYMNTSAPGGTNPVGTHWHVRGRFGAFHASYPGTRDHNLCPFLLLHGLKTFG